MCSYWRAPKMPKRKIRCKKKKSKSSEIQLLVGGTQASALWRAEETMDPCHSYLFTHASCPWKNCPWFLYLWGESLLMLSIFYAFVKDLGAFYGRVWILEGSVLSQTTKKAFSNLQTNNSNAGTRDRQTDSQTEEVYIQPSSYQVTPVTSQEPVRLCLPAGATSLLTGACGAYQSHPAPTSPPC